MASRAELEALLERDPDDVKTASVLADLLIELGDPFGEVLERRIAGKPRAEVDDGREGRVIFGRSWRPSGFLFGLTFTVMRLVDVEAFAAALASYEARFVEHLQFNLHGAWPEQANHVLFECRPRITSIGFGASSLEPAPTTALGFLPRHLERLTLSGGELSHWLPELGRREPLRALRVLSLQNLRFAPGDVDRLVRAHDRVPDDCALELPSATTPFEVEASLRGVWRPCEVPVTGPALMVTAPREDAGRLVCLGAEVSTTRIGHHPNCELQIVGANLFQMHAAVERRADVCRLRAVGGAASTLIDGRLIPEEGMQLHHGARITVGHAELVFLERDVAVERERRRPA